MLKERLKINNNIVPIEGSLNPSLNKSIKDIREPDKAKSTYSKTASIPSAKIADSVSVFDHVFEYNLTDGSFNPNLKVDCEYEVGGEIVLRGYAQLKEVEVIDNENRVYNIVMYGETANFFNSIKNLKLEDLDMSEWDHPLDREVQRESWDDPTTGGAPGQVYRSGTPEPFAYGTGYVYPLINWGFSTNPYIYDFRFMSIALYAKEIVDKIFEEAGFQYNSTFFDSDFFKRLIIPFSPEVFNLDASEIALREFEANNPILTSNASTLSANLPKTTYSTDDVIIFQTEVHDAGADYDNTTGQWVAPNSGTYDFTATLDLQARFTPDSHGTIQLTSEIKGYITLHQDPNGALPETQIAAIPFYITRDYADGLQSVPVSPGYYETAASPTHPDEDYQKQLTWSIGGEAEAADKAGENNRDVTVDNRYTLHVPSVPVTAGDKFRVKIKAWYKESSDSLTFWQSALPANIDGEAQFNIISGTFQNKVVNATMGLGDTIVMSKVLRGNWKQDEFMKSLIKMFNLFVEPDTETPTLLNIEPRDDYFKNNAANTISIHDKIDRSKKEQRIPMANFSAKDYLYTYKPDSDHYNEKYTKKWVEVYGERRFENENEFTQKLEKSEIMFSPTVMVAPPATGFVVPHVVELNELGETKPTSHNLRILYYDGLHATDVSWRHRSYNPLIGEAAIDDDEWTTYPYAGHLDDPFAPTVDINFGVVKEVFYDDIYADIDYTNNNLFNAYHLKQVLQMTHPLSKIVKNFVHMTPRDYNEWTFDKLYFFDETYWRLNKVINYNPNSPKTTQCEWVRYNDVGDFSGGMGTIDGADEPFDPAPPFGSGESGQADPVEAVPLFGQQMRTKEDGNVFWGQNIQVQGQVNRIGLGSTGIEIVGNYNLIENEVKNVKILGDNNIIEGGLSNITLINTNGVTVTESNVTYINGQQVGGTGATKDENANFTANHLYSAYCVDTSGGDVTVSIDFRTWDAIGTVIDFKKPYAANRVIFSPVGSDTLDGSTGTKSITGKNDGVSIRLYKQEDGAGVYKIV